MIYKHKFTAKDFADIWDHLLASTISPSIAKKVADRANELLTARNLIKD